ncbi:MAG: hypothetical protein RR816_11070, partial [Clostridia bacterium]
MFDLVISNVFTVEGMNGQNLADVCIHQGKIAQIQPPHSNAQAMNIIDGTGLLLSPGFIDIHRHADLLPFSSSLWSELAQGLTSIISGNCGFSCVPNAPETFSAACNYSAPILGAIPQHFCGMSSQDFFDEIKSRPLRLNCGYLVGNGSLRRSVTGFSNAPLTNANMQDICQLLDDALSAGAMGLSMGIMYTPECYYSTQELSRIAQIAAHHGKPVISHIRGEGRSVIDSIDEMITIGRTSGARIHISHMKAAGTDMWGKAIDTIISHIDQAQREGIDVTFDAYPYTAGSTTLLSLFPPETLSDATEGILKQIADPIQRAYILGEFAKERDGWDNFIQSLGWGRVIVSGSSNPSEVGKSIRELAKQAHCQEGDYALDLLLREHGNVPIVLEEMAADDVRRVITHPDCIVISDSLYSVAGMPHPRKYGAFERFLC